MKIYLGKQTPEHKGDTSRELIDMWEESSFCEVVRLIPVVLFTDIKTLPYSGTELTPVLVS